MVKLTKFESVFLACIIASQHSEYTGVFDLTTNNNNPNNIFKNLFEKNIIKEVPNYVGGIMHYSYILSILTEKGIEILNTARALKKL